MGCFGSVQTVSADGTGRINSFKAVDTYNDYRSVATVDGTWGANLFEGNDGQKVFIKILPKDSQWQVYGYTKRLMGIIITLAAIYGCKATKSKSQWQMIMMPV
ncbi:hypothetical protein JCM14202_3281 [Agrilactobacillus composti DSM 18527 = JCM 14202]|nr:hypothetical protein JCM14202_3281 [Agrilactobacillus composti DSM 18527 = JCM 14202]